MSDHDSHQPFEIEIAIESADIDQLGHVNNVVYLRWVQDAAIAHWMAAATEQEKTDLLWVVAKHEIEYRRPALAGDTIVALTWIGGASRRGFERHTELLRKSDRKLLARACTLWRPVDFETKKPVRVSPEIQERFSVPRSI